MSSFDLSAPWAGQPLVVIDFETTGVGPDARPVEVGAVRFEDRRVVAKFSTFLDPCMPIPADATAVHGITQAMVDGEPQLIDVASQLFDVCKDAIPCAYNAPFDRQFLHRDITGLDCPAFTPDLPWVDVYVIIAKVDRFVKGKGAKKLPAACARYGIEMDTAHRSEADAAATGHLLYRLLEKNLVRDVPLRRLLEHTDKMRAEHDRNFQEYLEKQRRRANG